jgi:hypothetical protein
MDPSSIVIFAIAALALWHGPRLILDSFGRTGDALAVLFVPPDWKLGWPHGVQEGDADWGWRSPATTAPEPAGGAADDTEPQVFELIDESAATWTHGEALVIEPRRVHRS